MASKLVRLGAFAVFTLVSACSEKAHHKDELPLFSGECRVEVISKTEDAEILVDGVAVGHEHVALEVPCGEKHILVERSGYVPYTHYLPANKGQPLIVHVELAKQKESEIEALSAALLEKARGPKIVAKASQVPAAKTSEAAAAPKTAGGGDPKNVEDWR